MADMFGAPLGINAADANIRANILSGMNAAKALGEIEAIPAEIAFKKAQATNQEALARYHTAQAAETEEKAAAAAQLRRIEESVRQEDLARARTVEADRLRGHDTTVADIPAGGFARRESPAERLTRLADRFYEKGAPLASVVPFYDKAANIAKDEAATANSRANERVHQLDAVRKQAVQLGSMAQAALMGGQQAYDLALLQAAESGILPPQLLARMPRDVNAAKPVLQNLLAQSVTAKEKADMEARKIGADAAKTRAGAAAASASAAVKKADAYVQVQGERLKILKKHGGEAAPEVVELRRERTEASRAAREARDARMYPPAPIDPKSRVVGQTYTAANGTRFLWTKDPISGNNVAQVIANPAADRRRSDDARILEEAMKDED